MLKRTRCRNLQLRCSYQLLEPRQMLAGDVSVAMDGTTLIIQGDNLANELTISSIDGSIVVSGVETTVNGAADFDAGSFVKDVDIRMGAGNDQLVLSSLNVQGSLTVFGDSGADRFELNDTIARYIHIDAGAGNDTLDVVEAGSLKSVYFHLGAGDDVVSISSLITGRNFRVFAGDGSDTIAANQLHVGRHLYLEMLTGDDEVLLAGETNVRKTVGVDLGFGDDSFIATPTVNGGQAEFRRTVRVNAVDGSDSVLFDAGNTFQSIAHLNGGNGTDSLSQSGLANKDLFTRKFENPAIGNLNQILDGVFSSLENAGFDATQFGDDDPVVEQVPTELDVDLANATFTENGSAIDVDSTLALRGDEATTVNSATVSITGFQANQDALAYEATIGGITGAFDDANGVLTLTGTGSLAEYQSALRSVTYFNESESPSTSDRSFFVSVAASDQTVNATRALAVVDVNDAVQITLPDQLVSTTIAELPASLAATLAIADVDDSDLESATVSILDGFVAGDDMLTFTGITGGEASYDSSAGVLTITGPAPIADIETLLRSVSFDSLTTIAGERLIEFEVSDGDATQSVNVMLSIVQEPLEINATATPIDFVENGDAITVDSDLSLAPPNRTLTGATVSIINGFVTEEDVLNVDTGTGSITAQFNSTTGVLTLAGDATVAVYQELLRRVSFDNTSNDLSVVTRVIEFSILDGDEQVSATREVAITQVDNR